ncbi:hypothetical protein N7504_004764 [Penicillium tannophilum]|nr:hypothetical protein N7504_004764 [Penicillium tannophilum]
MALVTSKLRQAPSGDPTLSLMQALADFKQILTDEEKRQYQANVTTPGASSIIEFVRIVDENKPKTTMRCMGSRLCTFLDRTQQFSGIVETFASSNPAIAALVWGSVKFAILTANNVASYFEKVTELVMSIGKLCPSYDKFSELYPGCIELQNELCIFYAIIIRMCTKIVEVSRRQAVTQMISSLFIPFEREFKPFLELLEKSEKDVGREIEFASQKANQNAIKLQEYDSKRNARFRLDFYKASERQEDQANEWRIDKLARDSARLRSRIRKNLSTIDHLKPWKQAIRQRVPGTAEWLCQDDTFGQWKSGTRNAFFWCSGKIGVGKTVLSSNVVSRLHASRKANEIISHHFCCADNKATLSARNIMGSLACQLMDSQIATYQFDDLQTLHDITQNLDTMEVTELLLSCLGAGKAFFLIIDGLDECNEEDCQEVILSLTRLRLCDKINVKIFISSRPDIEAQLFSAARPQYRVTVTEKRVKPDIDVYIDVLLSRLLEEGKLKLRDGTLIATISQALRDGSDGMILWTRLFMEELCGQGSDRNILKALTQLPRGLAELYDQKLRRIMSKQNSEQAKDLLGFCHFMKRALTLLEYEDFLGIKPEQDFHSPGNCPNDMVQLISDCCGLVFIDEEDSTVHYVHHSVGEHLLATKGSCFGIFDMADVDQHLGVLCLTYLDFNDFKRQLAKVREGSSTPIQPVHIGLLPLPSVGRRVALQILSRSRDLRHFRSAEVERYAKEITETTNTSRSEHGPQRVYPFLLYAQTYWIEHLRESNVPTDGKIWRLFCQCVEGRALPAKRPWDEGLEVDDQSAQRRTGWLLRNKHRNLLWYYGKSQPRTGHVDLDFDILKEVIHRLEHGCGLVEEMSPSDWCDWTRQFDFLHCVLIGAAWAGCKKCIDYLIKEGSDPNIPSSSTNFQWGRTALQAAAGRGHLEIVKTLIQAKAEVNAAPAENDGRTALQAAAEGGHLEVMKILIEAKANVNAADRDGRTALQAAAGRGHLEIVKTLIQAKADVNAAPAGYDGRTALHEAARGGHPEVINVLIEAKANVNVADRNGRTALRAAITGGHLEVVNRLMQANAYANAVDLVAERALRKAVRDGYSIRLAIGT